MRTTHFVIALVLCACSVVLAVAQEQETLKILSVVNEQSRPRLAKRLEEFISYNRAQEWDKVLKLLDKQNASHTSLETFSKERSKWGRLDFVPERATAEEPKGEEYRIYGCVSYTKGGVQKSFKGGVVAYLQEGDWYFTTYFLRYGSDASPVRCK